MQSVVCFPGRPYSQLCRPVSLHNSWICFRFLLSTQNQMSSVLAYLRQKIKTTIEKFEKYREIMACTKIGEEIDEKYSSPVRGRCKPLRIAFTKCAENHTCRNRWKIFQSCQRGRCKWLRLARTALTKPWIQNDRFLIMEKVEVDRDLVSSSSYEQNVYRGISRVPNLLTFVVFSKKLKRGRVGRRALYSVT
jgi:hypothetical protein